MAYESEVTYSGQQNISTIGGGVRLDEGRGRLVISENGDDVITLSKQGLDFFNESGINDIRLGKMPDGQRYLLIMKPGYSISNGFI